MRLDNQNILVQLCKNILLKTSAMSMICGAKSDFRASWFLVMFKLSLILSLSLEIVEIQCICKLQKSSIATKQGYLTQQTAPLICMFIVGSNHVALMISGNTVDT